MSIQSVAVRLTGTQPLILHSERGANPLDPLVQEMKKYSGKRKKTETDYAAMARYEFELSFYPDDFEELGPYIPPQNIFACVRDAAKATKKGRDVVRGVFCESPAPIIYEGPRTVAELWQQKEFVDFRTVVVGRARVNRCRSRFDDWAIEPTLLFDSGVFALDEFVQILEHGGRYVGLGDYRPRFGRFDVKVLSGDAEQKRARGSVSA